MTDGHNLQASTGLPDAARGQPLMRSAPRILVVGYHAFDVTVAVDGPVPVDGKIESERILVGGGGPGATAAVALARLGAEVVLVSPLTDDLGGRRQREELAAAGVDMSRCPILSGYASPLAVILVDRPSGRRTIHWSRGDLPRLDPDHMDRSWLEGVDLLYTDGHEVPASLRLAEEARRIEIPVVMDAGSVREGSDRLVAVCTDVISSSVFAPALTGRTAPADALRRLHEMGPRRVAMTFGERGLLAWIDGGCVHVPAFDVPVVDTTGAGDVFHAGYAFVRASGAGFADCLEFGSATAALKCRDWGGRSGLPDLEEVETLLAVGRRRRESPPLFS